MPSAAASMKRPVQAAVLDGFGDLRGGDVGDAVQVGDGAGNLQGIWNSTADASRGRDVDTVEAAA